MIIHILDNNLKKLDILRKYTFLQYTDEARNTGSFKVLAQLVPENNYLLDSDKQYYILFDDEVFGKIEDVVDDSDGEYSNTITLTGRLSKVIFTKRVINGTINFYGKSPEYIKAIVDFCMNLEDVNDPRYIPIDLEYVNESSLISHSSTVSKQVTGGYAWDEILEIINQDKLSISLDPVVTTPVTDRGYDTNISNWKMRITRGADRRKGNEEGNTPIIFSRSLSNISRTKYSVNTTKFCNVAYIAGEGESEDRKWYEKSINEDFILSENNTGWNRNELWIDARDIQSTNEDGTEITEEEYQNLIAARVSKKAVDNSVIKSYEGTVSENSKYTYGVDYFLGDWVTVEDYDLGIQVDAQIISATVSEQNSRKIVDVSVLYGSYEKDPSNKTNENAFKLEQFDAKVKRIENKVNKMSDFIVETHLYDSEGWSYVKYMSGRCELEFKKAININGITIKNGGIYCGSPIDISFPFEVQEPQAISSIFDTLISAAISNITSTKISITPTRYEIYPSSINIVVSAKITGKWK